MPTYTIYISEDKIRAKMHETLAKLSQRVKSLKPSKVCHASKEIFKVVRPLKLSNVMEMFKIRSKDAPSIVKDEQFEGQCIPAVMPLTVGKTPQVQPEVVPKKPVPTFDSAPKLCHRCNQKAEYSLLYIHRKVCGAATVFCSRHCQETWWRETDPEVRDKLDDSFEEGEDVCEVSPGKSLSNESDVNPNACVNGLTSGPTAQEEEQDETEDVAPKGINPPVPPTKSKMISNLKKVFTWRKGSIKKDGTVPAPTVGAGANSTRWTSKLVKGIPWRKAASIKAPERVTIRILVNADNNVTLYFGREVTRRFFPIIRMHSIKFTARVLINKLKRSC